MLNDMRVALYVLRGARPRHHFPFIRKNPGPGAVFTTPCENPLGPSFLAAKCANKGIDIVWDKYISWLLGDDLDTLCSSIPSSSMCHSAPWVFSRMS